MKFKTQVKIFILSTFLFFAGGLALSNTVLADHDGLTADVSFLVKSDGCWLEQVIYAMSDHLTDAQAGVAKVKLDAYSQKMQDIGKAPNILYFEKSITEAMGKFSVDITVVPADMDGLRDFCSNYPDHYEE